MAFLDAMRRIFRDLTGVADCATPATTIECSASLSEKAARSLERARFNCPATIEIELAPEGWQIASDGGGIDHKQEASAR